MRERLRPTLSALALAGVETVLRTRVGLVFSGAHQAHLRATIERLAASSGQSAEQYAAGLVAAGADLDELLGEITVGETYFFRDVEALDVLEREIIPGQLAARPHDHRYRAWSAGCATGEEAYTLAMICDDAGLAARSEVLGTDLCAGALARARAGIYRSWSLRGPGAARGRSRLEPRGGVHVIPAALRRRVRFELLNLASDAYPSLVTGTVGQDLILCRNVLIYLDRETVARVAARLWACLGPGGWLLTAASDPPLHGLASWSSSRVAGGVWYGREVTAARPARGTGAVPARRSSPRTTRPPLARRKPPAIPRAPSPPPPLPPAAADRVRALADRGELGPALRAARESVAIEPAQAELQYLVAVIAFEHGLLDEAAAAVRRARYLDPSLAIVHVLDGAIARRRGRAAAAGRAFRTARTLLGGLPSDQPVALGDGVCAGRLAAQVEAQLAQLPPGPR